jgi:uncharacterized membrane protein YdbT with pleckstrin-like domain
MGYVEKVLLPGERVIYTTGLHWLVYGRSFVLLAIAILLAIFSVAKLDDPNLTAIAMGGLALAAFLAFLGLLSFIAAAVRRSTTELAVTDQRVILKRGVIARHTIEMNRSKVESVDVDQSVLGRIFGYGTVLVRGTGGSLEPMQSISDPLRFRSHITAEAPLRSDATAAR